MCIVEALERYPDRPFSTNIGHFVSLRHMLFHLYVIYIIHIYVICIIHIINKFLEMFDNESKIYYRSFDVYMCIYCIVALSVCVYASDTCLHLFCQWVSSIGQ